MSSLTPGQEAALGNTPRPSGVLPIFPTPELLSKKTRFMLARAFLLRAYHQDGAVSMPYNRIGDAA